MTGPEYYDGRKLIMPSILTSRWTSPDGREAQILANYTEDVQSAMLVLKNYRGREIRVFEDPGSESYRQCILNKDEIELKVEPSSAVMVEII